MSRTLERDYDLVGWDEIAEVLDCHERTARSYASRHTDPLPVYAGLGKVVAVKEEVKAWLRRQFVAKRTADDDD